jgi:hypothetical protein
MLLAHRATAEQVFVETLDKYFEDVCELDLIFHVDKVLNLLDEILMGGMVLETSQTEIISAVEASDKMEKMEGNLVKQVRDAGTVCDYSATHLSCEWSDAVNGQEQGYIRAVYLWSCIAMSCKCLCCKPCSQEKIQSFPQPFSCRSGVLSSIAALPTLLAASGCATTPRRL